jgi:hypothetical protein
MRLKERKSYIILVLISIALSGLSILYSAHLVTASNKKFCTVINMRVIDPVPKPTASLDREAEVKLRKHIAFVALKHDLGC